MSDLRTQRLTIEVSFDADEVGEPALWDWNAFVKSGPNESISILSAEASRPQRPQHRVGRKS